MLTVLTFGFLYLLLLGYATWLWTKLAPKHKIHTQLIKETDTEMFSVSLSIAMPVSVIVPFRNEKLHMPTFLENLQLWDYKGEIEFIFINDHSTDGGEVIVKQEIKQQIRCIDNIEQGKKSALHLGIQNAQYDLIATLDADCVYPSTWLSSMVNALVFSKAQLVQGPVLLEENNQISKDENKIKNKNENEQKKWFHPVLEIESFALIGFTALGIWFGRPSMANAANRIFRKSAYQHADMKTDLASGDDTFLMHHILKQFGQKSISYLLSPENIVSTLAPASLSEMYQQRLRWASKYKHQTDASTLLLGFIIFAGNFAFLGALFLGVYQFPLYTGWMIGFLILKIVLDRLFLREVLLFMGKRINLLSYILSSLIYPVYVIVIGLVSQWKGYEWKGRKVS